MRDRLEPTNCRVSWPSARAGSESRFARIKGSFDDPASGRITRRGALRRRGRGGIFTFGDVRPEVTLEQFATKGFRVIAFISAQMMNSINGFRSGHEGRVDHFQGTDDVVVVGSGHHHSQRCTSAVYQDMALRTPPAPIGGVRTAQLTSQGSKYHLAIDRFPAPLDVSLLMIILHHSSMHLLPQTSFVSRLKAGMQTAAGSIPFLLQAFPLTATTQNE